METFGKLYDFSVSGGIIIPDTSEIKSKVQEAFRYIFGADFSLDESTINGRLIESIVVFFRDVLGVNAQNVNSLNIEQALGLYLDNFGYALGVSRGEGESDYSYRKRIISSFSRGSGFASSITNAISNINGVQRCVVLDNGGEDAAILPVDNTNRTLPHSIAVSPHSVLISVLSDNSSATENAIAEAIAKTKACGCGFTKLSDYGTIKTVIVNIDGINTPVSFYKPSKRFVTVSIKVSSIAYRGLDIVSDVKNAIRNLINGNNINSTITVQDIAAALVAYGIVLVQCDLKTGDTQGSLASVSEIVLPAYKYADIANNDISVTIQ